MSYIRKRNIISLVVITSFFAALVIRIISKNAQLDLILLIFVLVSNILASTILDIDMSRTMGILYKQCDPERFVDAMLKNYPEKNRDDDAIGTIYSIARGLIAAGRFEEALAELDYIKSFPEGSFSVSEKRFYYEYLISIYIEQQDIPQAEGALEALKELASSDDASIFMKGTLKKHYAACALLLNMAKGNFEGAEEFFTRKFRKARNNYNRVCAQYRLGEIYSHSGDTTKAKEAFEYVAEYGNKLYIAAKAREALKSI